MNEDQTTAQQNSPPSKLETFIQALTASKATLKLSRTQIQAIDFLIDTIQDNPNPTLPPENFFSLWDQAPLNNLLDTYLENWEEPIRPKNIFSAPEQAGFNNPLDTYLENWGKPIPQAQFLAQCLLAKDILKKSSQLLSTHPYEQYLGSLEQRLIAAAKVSIYRRLREADLSDTHYGFGFTRGEKLTAANKLIGFLLFNTHLQPLDIQLELSNGRLGKHFKESAKDQFDSLLKTMTDLSKSAGEREDDQTTALSMFLSFLPFTFHKTPNKHTPTQLSKAEYIDPAKLPEWLGLPCESNKPVSASTGAAIPFLHTTDTQSLLRDLELYRPHDEAEKQLMTFFNDQLISTITSDAQDRETAPLTPPPSNTLQLIHQKKLNTLLRSALQKLSIHPHINPTQLTEILLLQYIYRKMITQDPSRSEQSSLIENLYTSTGSMSHPIYPLLASLVVAESSQEASSSGNPLLTYVSSLQTSDEFREFLAIKTTQELTLALHQNQGETAAPVLFEPSVSKLLTSYFAAKKEFDLDKISGLISAAKLVELIWNEANPDQPRDKSEPDFNAVDTIFSDVIWKNHPIQFLLKDLLVYLTARKATESQHWGHVRNVHYNKKTKLETCNWIIQALLAMKTSGDLENLIFQDTLAGFIEALRRHQDSTLKTTEIVAILSNGELGKNVSQYLATLSHVRNLDLAQLSRTALIEHLWRTRISPDKEGEITNDKGLKAISEKLQSQEQATKPLKNLIKKLIQYYLEKEAQASEHQSLIFKTQSKTEKLLACRALIVYFAEITPETFSNIPDLEALRLAISTQDHTISIDTISGGRLGEILKAHLTESSCRIEKKSSPVELDVIESKV